MQKLHAVVSGLFLGCAVLGISATSAIAVPFFQGVGDLTGGVFLSHALGVSSDGSVVVGQSVGASGTEAFRWTASGGIVSLGFLPDFVAGTSVGSVSADGSVIVGTGRNTLISRS